MLKSNQISFIDLVSIKSYYIRPSRVACENSHVGARQIGSWFVEGGWLCGYVREKGQPGGVLNGSQSHKSIRKELI